MTLRKHSDTPQTLDKLAERLFGAWKNSERVPAVWLSIRQALRSESDCWKQRFRPFVIPSSASSDRTESPDFHH
jgi:hypothetical protein